MFPRMKWKRPAIFQQHSSASRKHQEPGSRPQSLHAVRRMARAGSDRLVGRAARAVAGRHHARNKRLEGVHNAQHIGLERLAPGFELEVVEAAPDVLIRRHLDQGVNRPEPALYHGSLD